MSSQETQALLDLRELVEKTTGIYYVESSLPLLADRLRPRVTALRLRDLLDYYYFLKWDPRRDSEWETLLEHLTVNETHFWREADALEWALRKLRGATSVGQHLRVWHAACSSGEEPYSLAMGAMQMGLVPWRDFETIASDLDPTILGQAILGRYSSRALRNLPGPLRQRFFLEGEKALLLGAEARAAVRFFRLNLHDGSLAWPRDCDIIFCRNVFIYFRPNTICEVARRFCHCLKPGGYLVLGASESLLQLDTPFEFVSEEGVIVYRKGAASP